VPLTVVSAPRWQKVDIKRVCPRSHLEKGTKKGTTLAWVMPLIVRAVEP